MSLVSYHCSIPHRQYSRPVRRINPAAAAAVPPPRTLTAMLPPISADEAALLRAVCLDPWDVLPRLVMADWYEENGRPDRAAFIRAAVEFSRDPNGQAAWLARATNTRTAAAAELQPRAAGAVGSEHARGWWAAVGFRTWGTYEAAAAAGLWGRMPVTRAVCWQSHARFIQDDPAVYMCYRGPSDDASDVPPGVFDRLSGQTSPRPARTLDGRVGYGDDAEAREALSHAMVDEGRSAAGLPPLAWPPFPDPPA